MAFLIYLLFSTMVMYCGVLLWLIIGNIIPDKKKSTSDFQSVSIIVAIRNGENALPHLIADLLSQNYPGKIEIILVDDQSKDSTAQIIREISIKDRRFIYQTSTNGDPSLQLKKRALDAGIKLAQNEWLLFTDVDCRLSCNWIKGMAGYFNKENDYIIGHSDVKTGNTLLNLFQSLDYFLLLISARGAANLKCSLACTGQNQAYRKSLYYKVRGFSRINNQMQGDDSLFLNICRKYGNAIVVFADDSHSHVIARQEKTWISLLRQRIRWSGDANIMWKINMGFYIMLFGFFLLHLTLVYLFCVVILFPYYVTILLKFLTIKFSFEFLLYFSGSRQLDKPVNIIGFIVWYFVHIPYIVLMGLCSFAATKLNWRGRKLYLS